MTANTKTLILVRHAKSSWPDEPIPDHDRPLNKRGMRDAPRMARRLAKRGPRPERIIASSAARAQATAAVFASELELEPEAVTTNRAIYEAGVAEMIQVVRGIEDRLDRVMLVGHNPTFSELVRYLSGEDVPELPTCAVAILTGTGVRWSDLGEGALRLVTVDVPKKAR